MTEPQNIQEASLQPTPQGSQSKGLRLFANIISFLFHPAFFPPVMTYVLYKLTPASFEGFSQSKLNMGLLSITITATFFPLFSIFLMRRLGFIGSYKMPTAKERTIPLMATMIFYFWISHVVNSIPGTPVPLAVRILLLGNFWGVIAIFMVNIFTKISMHTSTAGSMIGIIIALMITSQVNMVIPLFVAIILAGIIGTARSILGAHQRGDIWLGYIIGILVQLSAYIYLK